MDIDEELNSVSLDENSNKFRSKIFNLVLYPDDETHQNAVDYIKQNFDYAMILHDKDIDEKTNKIKKEHYHIVLRFKNAKWNTALAEELNITKNYIKVCRNFKRSLQYLIHYNDETKYKYDLEDVKGNLRTILVELIKNGDKTESEKILEIFQWIDCNDSYIDIAYLCRYCAEIGYWDVLRRGFSPINKYLEKHNIDYCRS